MLTIKDIEKNGFSYDVENGCYIKAWLVKNNKIYASSSRYTLTTGDWNLYTIRVQVLYQTHPDTTFEDNETLDELIIDKDLNYEHGATFWAKTESPVDEYFSHIEFIEENYGFRVPDSNDNDDLLIWVRHYAPELLELKGNILNTDILEHIDTLRYKFRKYIETYSLAAVLNISIT
jgi:hypothetical protein